MKAPVQFDMDGVLANFYHGYARVAAEIGKPPLVANHPSRVTRYLEGDPAVWKRIKAMSDFWEMLPALVKRQTFARINAMQDERIVYFITNRVGLHPQYQTQWWLSSHGVERPTVVISNKKGEFARAAGVGYSIEDKAGNAVYIAYESPNTTSALLDWPFNRFDQTVLGTKVRRVGSVDEFLNLIESEGL